MRHLSTLFSSSAASHRPRWGLPAPSARTQGMQHRWRCEVSNRLLRVQISKCQKTMSLSHGHCGQKVLLCPSLALSWTKRVTKVVKKTKSHEKNRNSQKFRKVFSFWTKSKRKVFESQNSFFHVLKLDFRDFAFFEVRRFRRPIRSCSASCSLRFLDHQAVAFKWTSWSRQAELSELSIL